MIVLSDRKNFSAGRIALAIAVMRKKRALVNDARKESARLWKQYLNGRIWDDVDALCHETLRAISAGMEPKKQYEVARLFLLSKLIDEANVRRGRKPKKGLIHSWEEKRPRPGRPTNLTKEDGRAWLARIYGAKVAGYASNESFRSLEETVVNIQREARLENESPSSWLDREVSDPKALLSLGSTSEQLQREKKRLQRARRLHRDSLEISLNAPKVVGGG